MKTRIEQIKEAAKDTYKNPEDRQKGAHFLKKNANAYIQGSISISGYREAFRRGAVWADANPKDGK